MMSFPLTEGFQGHPEKIIGVVRFIDKKTEDRMADLFANDAAEISCAVVSGPTGNSIIQFAVIPRGLQK